MKSRDPLRRPGSLRSSAHRRHGLLSLLVLSAVFVGSFQPGRAADAVPEAGQRVLSDVKYLASDELEGRGVGTEGLEKAAEYVRRKFAAAGLDMAHDDGGGFQAFTMITGTELGTPNVLRLDGPDGKGIELSLDKDFRPCSFGGSGVFDAGIVFCGYGIDAPDKNYQEFDGIDLEGKVALIMRRVPQQGNPHGAFGGPHGGMSRHAELRTKVSNAFRHGAAAVLLVTDPYTSRQDAQKARKKVEAAEHEVVTAAEAFDDVDPNDQSKLSEARKTLAESVRQLKTARKTLEAADFDPLMKFGYGGNGENRSIPILHVKQAVCDRLLKASLGKTLEQIEADIDADLKPKSTLLTGWTAHGEATVKRQRSEVKNVIGILPGQGPHAEETIVIGAHYDHLGMGGEGSLAPGVTAVHNGADDNASGTAALIELARRLCAREAKLPRRVVFIAFTAEERGLIGSAHYVKDPVVPLEKTIAMFNMDMVGRLRDDKLTVFGIGTAPRWKELVERLGAEHGFKLSLKPDGFGPSDQSSFYGKQIPVLHVFTGNHADYHRPSDDWEKINVDGMLRVVDFVEDVILATADNPDPPKYLRVERHATAERSGSRPYFGSIPDFGGEGKGYALSGVSPGGPAEKAGLKGGDRIVQLGDQKIGGLEDFDLALRQHSPGEEVKVTVLRDGKELTFTVTLDEPK